MAGKRYGKNGKYSATEWKRMGYDKSPFLDILNILFDGLWKMSLGLIALIVQLVFSVFKFFLFDWWWGILKAFFHMLFRRR